MPDLILTINAGSSSLKLALFDAADLRDILRGGIEDLSGQPRLRLRDAAGQVTEAALPAGEDAYLPPLLEAVGRHGRLRAVGHRVVHGADRAGPQPVDAALLDALTELVPLAPLHQPHNLAPIRALLQGRPELPQIACFDTAFHQTMSATARRFAIPRALHDSGIRRYGAHGLSYEYIAGQLRERYPGLARVVVAHLGSGASLCALLDGRSVDTTMGLTPLDGLVMGTRCGALDPGVVLYLLQARGMSPAAVQDLLYHEAGLLGVSGRSADMRALLETPDAAASEAVELFVWRLTAELAAMAAALQGLDAVVFTGGIGEHSAPIRAAACGRLAWLGLELDAAANRDGRPCVSASGSRVTALVLPTDEEVTIARHCRTQLEPDRHAV